MTRPRFAASIPVREQFDGSVRRRRALSRSGSETGVSDTRALGAHIRDARKAHGLTQAALAGLAGTGVRLVSELERGKPGVQIGKAFEILAAVGLQLHVCDPAA